MAAPSGSKRGRPTKSVRFDKPVTKRQVKQMLRADDQLKYCDSSSGIISGVAVNYAGVVEFLTSIAMATTAPTLPYQRLGMTVRLKSLELSYTFGTPGSFADVYGTVRLVLVQWLKVAPSGVALTPAVLWQSSGLGGPAAPHTPFDYFNGVNASHQYKVLYDKTDVISPGGPGGITRRATIALKGVLSFSGTGGADTDVEANGIYLFAVSDSGATPDPILTYTTRIWFVDDA